jgi:hypothetical protein
MAPEFFPDRADGAQVNEARETFLLGWVMDRVRTLRRRAAECRDLSRTSPTPAIRDHYKSLAALWHDLAEKLANRAARVTEFETSRQPSSELSLRLVETWVARSKEAEGRRPLGESAATEKGRLPKPK